MHLKALKFQNFIYLFLKFINKNISLKKNCSNCFAISKSYHLSRASRTVLQELASAFFEFASSKQQINVEKLFTFTKINNSHILAEIAKNN